MYEITKSDFFASGGERNEMQFSTMVKTFNGSLRVAYFRYYDGK